MKRYRNERVPEFINGKPHYKCSQCQVPKIKADFQKQALSPLGIRSACKACTSAAYLQKKYGEVRPIKLKLKKPTKKGVVHKSGVRLQYEYFKAFQKYLYRQYLVMDNLCHEVRIIILAKRYGQEYANPIQAITRRIRQEMEITEVCPISQEIEQAVANFKVHHQLKEAA